MSYLIMIIKEGVCAFHRSYVERSFGDIHLVGGFFHALITFSKELGEGCLDSIKYSDLVIYFKSVKGFTFVLGVVEDITIIQEQIEFMLNMLVSKFHDLFPNANAWDGNTAAFDDFAKICDEVLQEKPKRKGFPLLLKVNFKPFLLGPALKILFIKSEKQEYFYELSQTLEHHSELLGHKKLKKVLEKPRLLYLPESNYLIYIHPFGQNKKDDITHFLCQIIKEDDWFLFYQLSSLILSKTEEIIPRVITHIQRYNKNPHSIEVKEGSPVIQDLVENWADLNQYLGSVQASLFEKYYQLGISDDIITEEQMRLQLINLISHTGNEFDKVIHAILTQDPVVFVGSKDLVEQTISALLNFYPHPSVTFWIESPTEYLISGTHPDNLQKFQETHLIVDLMNQKVIGGEKNEFCLDLVQKTVELAEVVSMNEAKVFFQGKIANLFAVLQNLMNLVSIEEENQPKELERLLKTHSPAALDLLAKMGSNLNIMLVKNIEKFLGFRKIREFMLPRMGSS